MGTQLFLPFAQLQRGAPRSPRLEPSEGVEIDADASEVVSGVPALLSIAGASVTLRRLPCGDYLVGHRFLVERKHAGDFAKSLYDGRLFRQLGYLRRSAPSPLLVVEGRTALFEQFWPPGLRSALLSVATDFRVPVLFTRKPEGTAALLLALGRRALKRRTGEYYTPSRPRKIFGRRARRLVEFHELLSEIPLVGPSLALRLMGHFGGLKALLEADAPSLAEVPGIGAQRAGRIREALEKRGSNIGSYNI